MAFETKLEGVDEIVRKLKLLPIRIGRNAARRALRKGANIVRDAARRNALAIDDPQSREVIAKNVAVAGGGSRRERQAGGVMMRVGVRGGAQPTVGDNGTPGGNTTHWRFPEFGTSKMRAQPFMRPAMAESAGKATDAIMSAMNVEIDKEIRKL